MSKWLQWTSLILLMAVSMTSQASTLTRSYSSVNVVELANFYCPYCYHSYQAIQPVKQAVKKAHGVYDFVPISLPGVSPWPANVYLSLPKAKQGKAAKALFNAAQLNGLKMQSAASACVVINDALPSITVQHCVNNSSSRLPKQRTALAWRLISNIKTQVMPFKLPIFVIEQNGKIIRVLSRAEYDDMNELVSAVANEVSQHA